MGKVGKIAKRGANLIVEKRDTAMRTVPLRPSVSVPTHGGARRQIAIPRGPSQGDVLVSGLVGEFGFRVIGLMSQEGRRWIEVISGEKRCCVPLDDFATAQTDALRRINNAGILVVNQPAKTALNNQVQAIRDSDWKQGYIADRRGWNNRCFVLGPNEVIGQEDDRRAIRIILEGVSAKWARRGTQAEWLAAAKLMVGQSRPILAACYQFVPPLLSIVSGFPNFGIEFVGEAGRGKSTIVQWAASVWGGDPTRETGFLETWDTTLAGLESTMRLHSHSLLGLDEINLLGSLDDRETRRLLESAVFRLCYGAEKARFGAPIPPRLERLCWLSTSNLSISDVLTGFAPEVAAAAAQRLITIPLETSDLGVFDRLAPGFTTSSKMTQHLRSASEQFFGTPIRAFLMHLVTARRQREPLLRAGIEQWVRAFLHHADVDPNHGPSVRVARSLGLVYAAGRLAQNWGVLPAEWQIGQAILNCYRAHTSLAPAVLPYTTHERLGPTARRTERSALDRIIDYALQYRDQLFDLRDGKVNMDDRMFAQAYGFLKGTTSGKLELLIPPARMRTLPHYLALMQELRNQGYARTEKGTHPILSTKVTIRHNKPADRVYCVRIPSGALS